ncbi:peptidoglycan DD-metalloendopeptidase family protein [Flavobacteriaceae bacterium KMM 6897]|nr:peptidoglycan DD-metalloendopeptidase family protein [Flavobacteriaceae bacterium KMM 6897]MEB8344606.1 peptidoglycan DD-metalloendopeptidase family protein [Flavobacteriaceae bacterium KMM 6898]
MSTLTPLERSLQNYSRAFISILESFPRECYTPLDLSIANPTLGDIDISKVETCQSYIDSILEKNRAEVAFGGYLEQRNLYAGNGHFAEREDKRNIHLGVDFWAPVRTKVRAPLAGRVHSFQNNSTTGDYGPTIILEHMLEGIKFHTLYGHLSLESLNDLYIGKEFDRNSILASLGSPDINVNYAPHLHFQIIGDMGEYQGDYPGVISTIDMEYYANNCPNPNLLLKVH